MPKPDLAALLKSNPKIKFDCDLESARSKFGDWSSRNLLDAKEMKALAVAYPCNSQEVSQLMSYCYQHDVKVVPSGGLTGLAGGANVTQHELVISFDKMNQVLDYDPYTPSILVQSGMVLENIQNQAKEYGWFFPLDLGAKGSCQIGGNLATNAGGLRFIRYGGAREMLLSVKVCLPDGRLVQLGKNLKKDNTGYDLKQLFVGSEGTLGLITEARLKLFPMPKANSTLFLAVKGFDNVLEIFLDCQKNNQVLTAFEFIDSAAYELVKKMKGYTDLFNNSILKDDNSENKIVYLLIEIENISSENLEVLFAGWLESGFVEDGILPSSSQEIKSVWNYRENITESIKDSGRHLKNDISLPLRQMSDFYKLIGSCKPLYPAVHAVTFGHLGDGNIHINYLSADDTLFDEQAASFQSKVYEFLNTHQGSISAEHGIGLLKKKDLLVSEPAEEIELMKKIKSVIDPKCLLNPGKIFDL